MAEKGEKFYWTDRTLPPVTSVDRIQVRKVVESNDASIYKGSRSTFHI